VETLLLHYDIASGPVGKCILDELVASKVELFGSPLALSILENKIPMKKLEKSFHHEYSDTKLTVTVVNNLNEAIAHINNHGSSHTEAIICEDIHVAHIFQSQVDSACVFHNASTRFADGFRFGLGAEVGISTNRIHARGPVGVDGLLTTKWLLKSTNAEGHVVGEFSNGEKQYTHKIAKL